MNISIDIDGTITVVPALFAMLSSAVRASGGKVIVVTSRSNAPEVWDKTRRELKEYGIESDELVIIPDGTDRIPCPHMGLDWYQQYLWQKVAVCVERNVDVVFEDDEKVVDLFKRFAPCITVFHVGGQR
jgi:hypothetical protein